LRAGIIYLWIAAATLVPLPAGALTFDGELSYTSDYIVRGISQTGGRSAGQIDLRVGTRDGTFVGVFASTLNRVWNHEQGPNTGWDYEVEAYGGHRFELSPSVPLIGRLAFTAGAGYYSSNESSYPFGNAGLAFEFKSLRVEASYYAAKERIQKFFPYGRVGNRFAASVSWHF
jgi:hypothetical protein